MLVVLLSAKRRKQAIEALTWLINNQMTAKVFESTGKTAPAWDEVYLETLKGDLADIKRSIAFTYEYGVDFNHVEEEVWFRLKFC